MSKSDFGVMCRALRMAKNMRQREVAKAIGIAPSTYGNLESAPYKVVQLKRAEALAEFYGLKGTKRQALLDAWERAPLSEFAQRQRERWAKNNQVRSKARNHDSLESALIRTKSALIEMTSLYLIYGPKNGSLCLCDFGGGALCDPTRSCDLCEAFQALGFPDGYQGRDWAIVQLDELQKELEAKGASDAPPS